MTLFYNLYHYGIKILITTWAGIETHIQHLVTAVRCQVT